MHETPPDRLPVARRAAAFVIDILILSFMIMALTIWGFVFYLNIAIAMTGTYEHRIADLWIEVLIVLPHLAVAVGSIVFYFRVLGRSGGTPGQRLMSR